MIPRIIHQFWDGKEMPKEYMEYCDGWRELHPGWQYMHWNLEGFWSQSGMYNKRLVSQAGYISPKAPMQFISDVIRYELLYKYGGVWLDVDIKPQKPIDPLCSVQAWISWEETDVWVNNAAMAAEPGHQWIKEAITGLVDNLKKFCPTDANTKKSGPQYLTPITQKWLGRGVEVYSKEFFFPYLWCELERARETFPDSYGIHRWNNRQIKKGLRT